MGSIRGLRIGKNDKWKDLARVLNVINKDKSTFWKHLLIPTTR